MVVICLPVSSRLPARPGGEHRDELPALFSPFSFFFFLCARPQTIVINDYTSFRQHPLPSPFPSYRLGYDGKKREIKKLSKLGDYIEVRVCVCVCQERGEHINKIREVSSVFRCSFLFSSLHINHLFLPPPPPPNLIQGAQI